MFTHLNNRNISDKILDKEDKNNVNNAAEASKDAVDEELKTIDEEEFENKLKLAKNNSSQGSAKESSYGNINVIGNSAFQFGIINQKNALSN